MKEKPRLVQSEQREVARVKKVRNRVGVLLVQRRLARPCVISFHFITSLPDETARYRVVVDDSTLVRTN